MARPQKYSNAEIIKALKETKGMVYLAAEKLGCDPDTIRNRAKQSKAIEKVLENTRGQLIDTAELKLYSAILDGQHWAIAMVLRTLGKNRGYFERRPTTVEELLELLPPQLAKELGEALLNEGDARPMPGPAAASAENETDPDQRERAG
jgi:hypothetical protein